MSARSCKPWCNHHVTVDPGTGEVDPQGGWCRHVRGPLVVEDAPGGRLVVGTSLEHSPPVLLEELELHDAERVAADLARLAADITRAVGDVRATLGNAA